MKKLQGIVSEIPARKTANDNKVVQFNRKPESLISASNAVYAPLTTYKSLFAAEEVKPVKKDKTLVIGICSVIILMSFALFGLVKFIGGQDSLSDNIEYITVAVSSGDTVWDLVKEKNPNYNGDIRELVHYASKRNGGVEIMAGEVIEIPVVKEVK